MKGRLTTLAIGVALFMLGWAQSAAAAPKHPYLGSFGSANEPSFTSATGLAVDQSNGDVLVLDNSAQTLSRWHADGTPDNFSALGTNVIDGQGVGDGTPQNEILGEHTNPKKVQVAVDHSGGPTNGDIYVTDSPHGVIDIFGSDGSYLGQLTAAGTTAFGEACGVAVDPSGDVYVATGTHGEVHKFIPSGAVAANSDDALDFAATEPCTLAAGAGATAGSLFVDTRGGPVTKFNASTGVQDYVVASGSNTTSSVDPGTGHVYVATGEVVKEYDASGASSATLVSTIQTSSTFTVLGVAINGTSGNVYVARSGTAHLEVFGPLVYGEAPAVITEGATAIANTEATLHGTVDPKEEATTWQFEYGTTTAYGNAVPASPGNAGEGSAPAPVSTVLTGLQPGTKYHYRLRATNGSGSATGGDEVFTTASPPSAETTGSPVRTATTAALEGRVLPAGAATTYHFEYGTEGPCASSSCQSTPAQPAGSGSEYVLVTEAISGLEPGTTYHYRVVADNGNVGGPSDGSDMTVTTRASDAPPAPAPYPGPRGSDRGWEQVNPPDTNGNPVEMATAISDSGERIVYQVNGGTSETETGTNTTQVLAERTPSGWKNVNELPPRADLAGNVWLPPLAASDLSTVMLLNGSGVTGAVTSFKVNWGAGSEKLYEPGRAYRKLYEASADASRLIMELSGSPDPAHPAGPNPDLYDVTSGSPTMVSLLPGNTVPACGVMGPGNSSRWLPENAPLRVANWVAPNGSWLVFPSEGDECNELSQLYLRDLEANETTLISRPPVSGPRCAAEFIKATGDSVFFLTQSRLVSEDTAVSGCSLNEGHGRDVYRYAIESGALECVTCFPGGVEADVPTGRREANRTIAVAANGSRVYFESPNRLMPGAATPGFYRVDVGSRNLRYIAPATSTSHLGDVASSGEAMSPNGSVIIFRSDSAALNPLNGTNNGGTLQYYRYDDSDRSLSCVSCPQGGGEPAGETPSSVLGFSKQAGPNLTPLDAAGDFAFVTPSPLVAADHNTASGSQEPPAGYDVYEWRDGQLLLVTDGQTQWAGKETVSAPQVSGITPSGRDLFFTVPEHLTSEAVDNFSRLYDARIGGGFPSSSSSAGCSGEPCSQPPVEASPPPPGSTPGSAEFSGPGTPKPRFHKRDSRHRRHRHRRHRRHHSAKHRSHPTQSRRTSR
ncbi:MAG TPA: hypothetical protein VF731_04620 [Solirubrobacterales bacterium]